MRTTTEFLVLFCCAASLAAPMPGPSASEVMAKVAENQERSVTARSRWTHHQDVLVRMLRNGGALAQEDRYEYTVLPTPEGVKKELIRSTSTNTKKESIDGEIARDLAKELMNKEGSKDGLDEDLFPFTHRQQEKYEFRLAGREIWKEHDVWRVTFKPNRKQRSSGPWAGEALIDASEYQPLLVTTTLAEKIPLAVRTLLGTNIGQLGFKVTYRKLEQDVWMPETYGGEFNIRALFFYSRRIGLSMRNSDFRVADVNSTIEYKTGDPER